MMKVELTKSGEIGFIAAAPANAGRCGKENNQAFKYSVTLVVDGSQLDENDFVIDHNNIAKYFAEVYSKEPIILSCEMIAMRAVKHFAEALAGRAQRIEVNIIADAVSHKVLWESQWGVPALPAIRSKVANIAERWAA